MSTLFVSGRQTTVGRLHRDSNLEAKIHYKSSLSCLEPGCAEPNFAQDIKYNIIAE